MPKKPRRRLLVDPRLQGMLLCRIVVYWFLSLTVMLILISLHAMLTTREIDWPVMIGRVFTQFGPALIASLAVLPLIAYDALQFSHRFAGPVHRLNTEMQRLSDGETLQPVVFRKGDYWGELATEFNRLSDEVHRLRAERPGTEREPHAEPETTSVG